MVPQLDKVASNKNIAGSTKANQDSFVDEFIKENDPANLGIEASPKKVRKQISPRTNKWP